MTNSADSDQLALKPTDLDLHCLQRQDISEFSRTRVNKTWVRIFNFVIVFFTFKGILFLGIYYFSNKYLNQYII